MLENNIPWKEWTAQIEGYYSSGRCGPMGIERMLRMYLLQIRVSRSDPATEDAICDSYAMHKFVKINFLTRNVSYETTLCQFCYLPEEHDFSRFFFDFLMDIWREGFI